MFRRFVAASAVGSLAIAAGAFSILLLLPSRETPRLFPLTAAWCFVPLAWGLWAMFAPAPWVPRRLPAWGAILGAVAGTVAGLVLNLPSRVAGEMLPLWVRWAAIPVGIAFYYCLWLLVRKAYQSLAAAGRL